MYINEYIQLENLQSDICYFEDTPYQPNMVIFLENTKKGTHGCTQANEGKMISSSSCHVSSLAVAMSAPHIYILRGLSETRPTY